MSVSIDRSSRLVFGELKEVDGVEFWDLIDLPPFYPRNNDILHEVADGDRLDRLADNYYQDPVLWWVIAWANDIELPQRVLTGGVKLVIPDPAYVANELFKTKLPKV